MSQQLPKRRFTANELKQAKHQQANEDRQNKMMSNATDYTASFISGNTGGMPPLPGFETAVILLVGLAFIIVSAWAHDCVENKVTDEQIKGRGVWMVLASITSAIGFFTVGLALGAHRWIT